MRHDSPDDDRPGMDSNPHLAHLPKHCVSECLTYTQFEVLPTLPTHILVHKRNLFWSGGKTNNVIPWCDPSRCSSVSSLSNGSVDMFLRVVVVVVVVIIRATPHRICCVNNRCSNAIL